MIESNNYYIPGIAKACWVSSDQVSQNESIWLIIGGQRIALAKAGETDDQGWRPIWWFAEGTKLPLCLCKYHQVMLHPCLADGTQDLTKTLVAKWDYDKPTDDILEIMKENENLKPFFLQDNAQNGMVPSTNNVIKVPLVYPCNPSNKKYSLMFNFGMAALNMTGNLHPDDPAFYSPGV